MLESEISRLMHCLVSAGAAGATDADLDDDGQQQQWHYMPHLLGFLSPCISLKEYVQTCFTHWPHLMVSIWPTDISICWSFTFLNCFSQIEGFSRMVSDKKIYYRKSHGWPCLQFKLSTAGWVPLYPDLNNICTIKSIGRGKQNKIHLILHR